MSCAIVSALGVVQHHLCETCCVKHLNLLNKQYPSFKPRALVEADNILRPLGFVISVAILM